MCQSQDNVAIHQNHHQLLIQLVKNHYAVIGPLFSIKNHQHYDIYLHRFYTLLIFPIYIMIIYSVTNPHGSLLICTIIWLYQYFSDFYHFIIMLQRSTQKPKEMACIQRVLNNQKTDKTISNYSIKSNILSFTLSHQWKCMEIRKKELVHCQAYCPANIKQRESCPVLGGKDKNFS